MRRNLYSFAELHVHASTLKSKLTEKNVLKLCTRTAVMV